jgi:hypothetical protein
MTKFSHLTDEELVRMGLADINPLTSTDLEIELLNRFGEASAALAAYDGREDFDVQPHHLELLRYLELEGVETIDHAKKLIETRNELKAVSDGIDETAFQKLNQLLTAVN